MRLYNSLTRSLVELPAAPAPIGIYVCGITPYDSPHLGHARAAVVFDALVRYLRFQGRQVTFVRNITDVDDKIIARAQGDLAGFTAPFIAEYQDMLKQLNCRPPDHEPRVSGHIAEILRLTERLLASGHAYAAGGSVYFAVRSFPDYGQLSHRLLDEMLAGTREDPDPEKQDPLDFALWKAAKPGEPSWPSPWGAGRPGWHIECSAMSMKLLGEHFEIHGGGLDLIFPHHENERAQSKAATGRELALVWMHNGLVTINRAKMAKSLGNAARLGDLLKTNPGNRLRFYLLSALYSSPLDFTEERLEESERALARFAALAGSLDGPAPATPPPAEFLEALEDDFNTARALSVLFSLVSAGHGQEEAERRRICGGIAAAGELLGLRLFPEAVEDREAEKLVAQREAARRNRDFAEADRLRKLLAERGVIVEDTAGGSRWRKSPT